MGDDKARELIAQAEKKLKSTGGFFGNLMGSNNVKYEEAVELYKLAANQYKMVKKWKEAGDAFVECAKLSIKLESKHDAAAHYVDASTCYKKTSAAAAVAALRSATDIFCDMGRLSIAAKQQQAIAEVYETELADFEQAITAYEQAADWFAGEESTSSATKCLLKVAQFSAQLGKYPRAAEIYEQTGRQSLDNNLLKYSAKDYFMKASLCQQCTGDLVKAQNALESYMTMYPGFADTREGKFVSDLLKALETSDADGFTSIVADYDSISRLDPWLTSILLVIKRQITSGGQTAEPLC
ncbi:soluble NSF attachment protein [Capsaspora owczarzaki ATCC 30864]|nr:soluble NSF attachment protein [Capsaspora owczarzaki ATCC 30864]|eukprot:XP_004364672.1 soluble NSF attachment protein [Capsaspora owczarzaki ATCC 30864]